MEGVNGWGEGTSRLVMFEGAEGLLRVTGFDGPVTQVGEHPSKGRTEFHSHSAEQLFQGGSKGQPTRVEGGGDSGKRHDDDILVLEGEK